jgi:hypothetical protein
VRIHAEELDGGIAVIVIAGWAYGLFWSTDPNAKCSDSEVRKRVGDLIGRNTTVGKFLDRMLDPAWPPEHPRQSAGSMKGAQPPTKETHRVHQLKVLLATTSLLLCTPALADWKYVEKVDELTGKSAPVLLSEQRNGSGAVAYVTAHCQTPGEVLFAALFTDEQGEAIPLGNVEWREGATKWSVKVRYRVNERVGPSRLPTLEFKNKVQVFGAFTLAKWSEMQSQIAMLTMAGYGTLEVLPLGLHKEVKLIKSEFSTEFGPLVVTIDTAAESIQRLYTNCFGSEKEQADQESQLQEQARQENARKAKIQADHEEVSRQMRLRDQQRYEVQRAAEEQQRMEKERIRQQLLQREADQARQVQLDRQQRFEKLRGPFQAIEDARQKAR